MACQCGGWHYRRQYTIYLHLLLSGETTRQTARLLCVGWDGGCCDGASEAPNALNLPYLAHRSHYVTYLELGCSLVTVIAPAFFGLYDLIGDATPLCLTFSASHLYIL